MSFYEDHERDMEDPEYREAYLAEIEPERQRHRANGCEVFDKPMARCTCEENKAVEQVWNEQLDNVDMAE